MSGCAHCVWDTYESDVAAWRARHGAAEAVPAVPVPDPAAASRAALAALERQLAAAASAGRV
jgi:hypothetical protein